MWSIVLEVSVCAFLLVTLPPGKRGGVKELIVSEQSHTTKYAVAQ